MAHRIQRVNSLIRHEISDLLQRQIKDPRLDTSVIVTEVATSADLRHAKLFISRIGSEIEKQATLNALVSAAPFFRRELAKRLDLPRIPELSFYWDDSIERGDRLLRLIDKVSKENDQPAQD